MPTQTARSVPERRKSGTHGGNSTAPHAANAGGLFTGNSAGTGHQTAAPRPRSPLNRGASSGRRGSSVGERRSSASSPRPALAAGSYFSTVAGGSSGSGLGGANSERRGVQKENRGDQGRSSSSLDGALESRPTSTASKLDAILRR